MKSIKFAETKISYNRTQMEDEYSVGLSTLRKTSICIDKHSVIAELILKFKKKIFSLVVIKSLCKQFNNKH